MNNRKLVTVLVLVIILLAAVILYIAVLKPAISGYAVDRRVEGYQSAVVTLMQLAATCQQVPLIYGNQTINVIAVDCLQPPAQ